MFEAIIEAIFEIVLTSIIEPIEEWITRITDKKTKKYNNFLRNMISVIIVVLLAGIFICSFTVVVLSYLQTAGLITPIFSAAFVIVCLIINTLFLASAIFLSVFSSKIKKQKYLVIPVSIIVFICNIICLINT